MTKEARDHGWAASCAGLGSRVPVTEFAGLKIWGATMQHVGRP